MNLPNKLTILRIIMIPFFVLFMLLDGGVSQTYRYIAAVIFIVASFTDLLDGKIARKYNLVTNFGKFMDPLRQASGLFRLNLFRRPWPASGLVRDYHYQPRVHHQRLPSGSV